MVLPATVLCTRCSDCSILKQRVVSQCCIVWRTTMSVVAKYKLLSSKNGCKGEEVIRNELTLYGNTKVSMHAMNYLPS